MWEEAEAASGRQSWDQPGPSESNGTLCPLGLWTPARVPKVSPSRPKPLTFLPARFPGTYQQARAAASTAGAVPSARPGQDSRHRSPQGSPGPEPCPGVQGEQSLTQALTKQNKSICLKGEQMPDRCVPNSHCNHRTNGVVQGGSSLCSVAKYLLRAYRQRRSDRPTAQRLWSQADEACPGWNPSFPLECCVTVGMSPYRSEPVCSAAKGYRHTQCTGFVNRSQGCHTGPGVQRALNKCSFHSPCYRGSGKRMKLTGVGPPEQAGGRGPVLGNCDRTRGPRGGN